MVVGSGTEGFETVDLKSKGGERLVGDAPTVVGAGTGAASGVDVVYSWMSWRLEG